MLAAVEFQNDKWAGSDQKFMLRMCISLMQRLTRMFERFVVSRLGWAMIQDDDWFIPL